MARVAEVHFEVLPLPVQQHAYPPCAVHGVAELPEDVIAVLVGESFAIGFQDAWGEAPERVLELAEDLPANEMLGAAPTSHVI